MLFIYGLLAYSGVAAEKKPTGPGFASASGARGEVKFR